MNVVIPDGTEKSIAAACAEITESYLDRDAVDVAVVFGFQSEDQVGNFFDRCRAQGTDDGEGYSGDGESIFGTDDDGSIQVEVGSAIGETQMFSFPQDD